MSLKGYSQSIMLNERGDTLVCFSVSQSKFLLKQCYRTEELDTLLSLCEKQNAELDSINKRNSVIMLNYKEIADNNTKIIGIKDYQIEKLNESLSQTNKDVRKQKVYKWIAIGVGTIIAGYSSYYIITH